MLDSYRTLVDGGNKRELFDGLNFAAQMAHLTTIYAVPRFLQEGCCQDNFFLLSKKSVSASLSLSW